VRQVALSGADSERVLDLAWLNSHFQAGLRNPLDNAIVESGPPRGAGWAKIDEVPFDFQRRRVSVLVEHEGRRLLVTKGAPEDIIKLATRYEEPGKPKLLSLGEAARVRAAKVFEGLSAEGFRALGVADLDRQPSGGTKGAHVHLASSHAATCHPTSSSKRCQSRPRSILTIIELW
jgi:Mg2+-importing ATPase